MGQGFAGFMGGGAPNPALYTPELIQRARWQALSQLGAGIMGAGAGTSAQRRQAMGQAFGGAGDAYQKSLTGGLAEQELLEKRQEEAEADKWRQMAQTNPQYLKSLGYTDDQIQLMKGMPEGMFEDVVKSRMGDMFKQGEQASWQQVEMLDENGKPAVYLFDPKNPNTPPKKLGEKKPKAGEGGFDDESKLRDQYLKQTAPFIATTEAYSRVQAGASGTSGADDIALVYGFMKMLDPTSAVREGEYATAETAGGKAAQYVNLYNRLLTGGRLDDPTRQSFVRQAGKQYEASRHQYEATRNQYTDLAKGYGFDPSRVAIDLTRGVTVSPDDPAGLGAP